MQPSMIAVPAYLAPIPNQDKFGGLQQEGHHIRHKNGGDDRGGDTGSPDGVASRWIVGASAAVIFPLHYKTQKMACITCGCPI